MHHHIPHAIAYRGKFSLFKTGFKNFDRLLFFLGTMACGASHHLKLNAVRDLCNPIIIIHSISFFFWWKYLNAFVSATRFPWRFVGSESTRVRCTARVRISSQFRACHIHARGAKGFDDRGPCVGLPWAHLCKNEDDCRPTGPPLWVLPLHLSLKEIDWDNSTKSLSLLMVKRLLSSNSFKD